jgi:hypothetical protein
MKWSIITIILWTFAECSISPHIKNEKKVKDDFYNKIEILGSYCPQQQCTNEFIALSGYFYELTGRIPSANIKTFSDFLGVPDSVQYSEIAYSNDKKVWSDWFEKNRNKITYEFSDSVYNRILNSLEGDHRNSVGK